MNDHLEQRLQRLGSQPTTPLDATTLATMEARVMATTAPRRRVLMPLVAAAAALLLLAGTVFAFSGDRRDSLQPGDTDPSATNSGTTVTSTSTTASGSTTSVAVPTTSPVPSTAATAITAPTSVTSPSATVSPITVPATAPTTTSSPTPATAPPTTSPPTPPTTAAPEPSQPVPAASFVLDVRRVDGQLRFTWPRYEGSGGQRYVLVRVGPGGLTDWPPAPARLAATVHRIGITFTALDMPGTEPRRWVLAVVGADRELLAVSSPVTSN